MTEENVVLDLRRPFTRADAIAAGVDPRLLRGSRFRRLFRGVYVDASSPDTPQLRIRAALRLFKPNAFASHASAARLHGVPIPALPDEHVSVVSADDRRANPGVRCTWRTRRLGSRPGTASGCPARAVACPGRGRHASQRRTSAREWTRRWRRGSAC